jgi:hypothetical protein
MLTRDLLPSEQRFVVALQQLGFGRFEFVRIHLGELVLDPWPNVIRSVKFGAATPNRPGVGTDEFEVNLPVAEFFAHVRGVESGVIRVLEVRGGLPFSMEIAEGPRT